MKAALVTGASQRIGGTIARQLARSGWNVILHYATSKSAAERIAAQINAGDGAGQGAGGGRASILGADLVDPTQATALIDAAFALEPDLELLVNNASHFVYDTAQTCTPDTLTRAFAVNARAPILLAQQFAAKLPQDRKGLVVNLLDNRISAPNPDYFSYGIAKFALFGATQMLALGLAPHVRVCGIAPGITLVSGEQSLENFAHAHRLNPLGQGCTPEEIAGAVVFIAGSPSMTGAIITLDGGQSLANPGRDVAFIAPAAPSDAATTTPPLSGPK